MADVPCPCCGAPMPTVPIDLLRFANLSPIARRTVDVLSRIYPSTLPMSDLADRVYANDPDGGPLSAANSIAATMVRYKDELARLGWRFGGRTSHAHGIGLWPIERPGVHP